MRDVEKGADGARHAVDEGDRGVGECHAGEGCAEHHVFAGDFVGGFEAGGANKGGNATHGRKGLKEGVQCVSVKETTQKKFSDNNSPTESENGLAFLLT